MRILTLEDKWLYAVEEDASQQNNKQKEHSEAIHPRNLLSSYVQIRYNQKDLGFFTSTTCKVLFSLAFEMSIGALKSFSQMQMMFGNFFGTLWGNAIALPKDSKGL